MSNMETKTTTVALLALELHALDPSRTPAENVAAAADLLDVAAAELKKRATDYDTLRGEDGLTQAERDAGWTRETVGTLRDRQLKLVGPQLPVIALTPNADQLQVLGEIHADIALIEALRLEALQAMGAFRPDSGLSTLQNVAAAEKIIRRGPPPILDEVTGPLFTELAIYYPGVANELLTYVLHSVSGGPGVTDAELPAVVNDLRVPGPYIPPDSERDTSGDAALIADDVAAQDRGRTAHNLGETVEDTRKLGSSSLTRRSDEQ